MRTMALGNRVNSYIPRPRCHRLLVTASQAQSPVRRALLPPPCILQFTIHANVVSF